MSDIRNLVERYLAVWNETDPQARRALVDALWAEDGSYTDPLGEAVGREAFDATVGAVQGQFPGLAFSLGPVFDTHHDLARFTWHLGPAGGEPLVVGFDVLVADTEGRVASVFGFLDRVPSA
ncbi:nuclear transport factor 2 family protein [Streptacidiphilus sp. ASG 303]|uniref:nuclear transport factor 2 family protein n=1 Tax=Streptacidiphilus sp. ASG 303 TaxID=2896847 RepID=UPI001E50D688|nr:nuclear transport factor 2 family protein [Streptacidiphilus sp. ASG 303]MCD0485571.1 nuclear transport factor 2 family protein [Streptacidiphilus sp. ASG 303]